jgi:hypothetical protein
MVGHEVHVNDIELFEEVVHNASREMRAMICNDALQGTVCEII